MRRGNPKSSTAQLLPEKGPLGIGLVVEPVTPPEPFVNPFSAASAIAALLAIDHSGQPVWDY